MSRPLQNLYKLASLYCLAAQGLVSSQQEAARILGVTFDASPKEINNAYKQKAKKLHPDTNPNVDPVEMKLLNAARDIMLNPNLTEEIKFEEETEEGIDPFPSYEDIAKERENIGRSEFNEKYPGRENELKREMCLDECNRIFEGYSGEGPNSLEEENQEGQWDSMTDQASDTAYNLIDKAEENGELNLYTSLSDMLDKYPELIDPSPWIQRDVKWMKWFKKELQKQFDELLLKRVDEFNIVLEDVLMWPNFEIVKSFLKNTENLHKYNIPNEFLASQDFAIPFISLLHTNIEECKQIINKYGNNSHFLQGLLKSATRFYLVRNEPNVKELILSLPFNDIQRKTIERWLLK